MASRKTPRAVELLERHARPKEKEIAKGLLWRAKAIEQAVKRLAPAVKQGFATGQLPPELTEAIEDIERTYIAKWLAPMWRECFLNAKKDIATEVARASGKKAWGESWDVDFPELSQAAADFIARQTGVRITKIEALTQKAWHDTLKQYIMQHSISAPSSPSKTAKEIMRLLDDLPRHLALTVPQMNYYNKKEREAFEAADKDEAKRLWAALKGHEEAMKRYRAIAIARTETAFAYNAGQLNGILAAQQKGDLSYEVDKIWSAAPGCCDECLALDGSKQKLDGYWKAKDGQKVMMPPLHPHCRCSMDFEFDESKPLEEGATPAAAATKPTEDNRPKSLEERLTEKYKPSEFEAFKEKEWAIGLRTDTSKKGANLDWDSLPMEDKKELLRRFTKLYAQVLDKQKDGIELGVKHENEQLAKIASIQGWFDKEPTVVSKAEMDKLISITKRELFRGTGTDRDRRHSGSWYAEQFRTEKEYYIGEGVYGDGIYIASSGANGGGGAAAKSAYNVANSYAYQEEGGVVRMALKPEAKLVSYTMVKEMARGLAMAAHSSDSSDLAEFDPIVKEFINNGVDLYQFRQMVAEGGLQTNLPALVVAMGYDGMTVSNFEGASCPEYVVLFNRTAVAIQKETPENLLRK